jgi:hypothetical protein
VPVMRTGIPFSAAVLTACPRMPPALPKPESRPELALIFAVTWKLRAPCGETVPAPVAVPNNGTDV